MRLGMTIPFEGVSLRELGPLVQRMESAGYDGLWSHESTGLDGFTPLATAALASERLRLVTGIVNVYTRGPALLAQSAAALADLSGGRFVLGLGASSDVIVEHWNGLAFDRPLPRVRDTARFLRAALAVAWPSTGLVTISTSAARPRGTAPWPARRVAAARRVQPLAGAHWGASTSSTSSP